MAKWDPAHVTPRVKLYKHTKFYICSSKCFSDKIQIFFLEGGGGFLITMVTIFSKFLAHVLSWVKSYHHAKFNRNPCTGLARMMVQTDRQTDISFYKYRRYKY